MKKVTENDLSVCINKGQAWKVFQYLEHYLNRTITESEAVTLIENCKTKEDISFVVSEMSHTYVTPLHKALERFKEFGALNCAIYIAKKLKRNLTAEELEVFVISAFDRHQPKWDLGIQALRLGSTSKAIEFAVLKSLGTSEKICLKSIVEIAKNYEVSPSVNEKLIAYFVSTGNIIQAQFFAEKNQRRLTEIELDSIVTYAMRLSNTELAQKALDLGASEKTLKRYTKWLFAKS